MCAFSQSASIEFRFGRLTGQFNDFYRFDPDLLAWNSLDTSIDGAPPSPRRDFGFAAAPDADRLYIFGGYSDTGSRSCGP